MIRVSFGPHVWMLPMFLHWLKNLQTLLLHHKIALQNFFDISQHISNSLLPLNAARELQRLESQTRWITNYWRSYMGFKVSRAKRPSRCGPSEQLTGTGVAISKQQQEGFKLAPAAFALEKVWEKLSLQRPINNNNIWTPPLEWVLTLSQGSQSRNQLLRSSAWYFDSPRGSI